MRKVIIFVLVILFVISGTLLNVVEFSKFGSSESELNYVPLGRNRAPKDVIRIDKNFDLMAIAKYGNGTIGNPYVIENLTIDAKGAGNCIYIGNTTLYFIIRNCSLTGADGNTNPTSNGAGITLNNVRNGRIVSNNVSNNKNGIYIYSSSNIEIEKNHCVNHTSHGNAYGIELYFSKFNTVRNNTIINNSHGITLLGSSSNNTIENNKCILNINSGIAGSISGNSRILNNTCKNNLWGIYLGGYNSNNIIMNNTCISNTWEGIVASHMKLVKNNYCSNNGYNGIKVADSDHSTIENNSCTYNAYYGIYVYRSNTNKILNNTCRNNNRSGICSFYSNSNLYENNLCNNNNISGILIDESSYQIYNANNCSNNQYGINLEPGSDRNTFYLNVISFNTVYGISIQTLTLQNNFYYNIIDSNQVQAIQSTNNNWDNGDGEGNYWSDYTGLDNGAGGRVAGDGIGDTNIPHPGTTYDAYPFMNRTGWFHMDPPILIDPGELDTDGSYSVTWRKIRRAYKYVLQEDTSDLFTSPIELFNDTGLNFDFKKKENGTYYYRLKGYNNVTESPWSNIVDIIIDWQPAAPHGLKIQNITGHEINLTWNANSEPDLGGYHILVNDTGTGSTGPFHHLMTVINSTTKIMVTDLIEETIYHFVILAFDKINSNSSYSNVVSGKTLDVTKPAAPTGLMANATSGSTIYVDWTANFEPDIKGYKLYMNDSSSGSDGPFHIINQTNSTDTGYFVENLVEETTYYFKLRAYDEVPNVSPFSNVVFATTPDMTPPSTPTGLKVIDTSFETITLSWNPNLELDVVGYILHRYNSPDVYSEFVKPSSELITNTSFIDTSVEKDSTYYYRLKAIDDANWSSSLTDFVSGSTLERPRAPVINNTISDFSIFEDTYDDISINMVYLFKDPNDDPLTYQVSGEQHIQVTIFQNNGTVVLIPEKDWNGIETLTFYANDSKFEISEEINVTVEYVNDPPGPAEILNPQEDTEINESILLNFSGRCTDPDLLYGDMLTFTWYSTIDGKLGVGENLTDIELSTGYHEISMVVSDKYNVTTSAKVIVRILKKSDEDGDKDKNGEVKSSNIMMIIIAITIILVVLIVLFLMFLRMKKKEDESSRVDEGMEE